MKQLFFATVLVLLISTSSAFAGCSQNKKYIHPYGRSQKGSRAGDHQERMNSDDSSQEEHQAVQRSIRSIYLYGYEPSEGIEPEEEKTDPSPWDYGPDNTDSTPGY
jgi:hypothetical protein